MGSSYPLLSTFVYFLNIFVFFHFFPRFRMVIPKTLENYIVPRLPILRALLKAGCQTPLALSFLF